jgi:hypothetical protein
MNRASHADDHDPDEYKRARTLNMTAEQAEAELKRKAKKGQ